MGLLGVGKKASKIKGLGGATPLNATSREAHSFS